MVIARQMDLMLRSINDLLRALSKDKKVSFFVLPIRGRREYMPPELYFLKQ